MSWLLTSSKWKTIKASLCDVAGIVPNLYLSFINVGVIVFNDPSYLGLVYQAGASPMLHRFIAAPVYCPETGRATSHGHKLFFVLRIDFYRFSPLPGALLLSSWLKLSNHDTPLTPPVPLRQTP
jgi:hypothetical protein